MNFIEYFFGIYWIDHMVFMLYSFIILHYIQRIIYIRWTILACLRWIPFDHGEWSFLCAVECSLLVFSWGFLHLFSSWILAGTCLLLLLHPYLVLVSGQCGLHRMSLEDFLLFSFFGLTCKELVFFKCLIKFNNEDFRPCFFSLIEIFKKLLIQFDCFFLFRFSIF